MIYELERPAAGYYKIKKSRTGRFLPVRIYYDYPQDPHTGELMDRTPSWHALINGIYSDIEDAWPYCARHPIEYDEYLRMMAGIR